MPPLPRLPARPAAAAFPALATFFAASLPALLPGLAAAVLSACAAAAPLTPYSAGERAARLANDRCQERYGARPFRADDYEAEFVAGRWRWGGEGSRHVDGFSASVTFASDGAGARVVVDRGEDRGNPDGL
jgi:hypothetical protein